MFIQQGYIQDFSWGKENTKKKFKKASKNIKFLMFYESEQYYGGGVFILRYTEIIMYMKGFVPLNT